MTTNKTPRLAAAATHRPGAFVWFEVRTPAPEKARAFFSEVVGWKITDAPMGPGMTYTLAATKDGSVAGIVKDERACMLSYVSVDDVDAAAKRVQKAGGTVKGAPMDVPTVGRMVEVADPDGASFVLIKSERGDAPVPPSRGAFLWNELWAKDEKRALAFFTSVLGYTVDAQDMGGMRYHTLKVKDAMLAGLLQSPVPGPSAFLPYVQVDDVDASLLRVRKLGGAVVGEAREVPGIGRFCTVRSPDGVTFAVMTAARA
ncbi:MAG TPA: VOC family protein [Myxococcota bacterium]